MTTPPVLSSAVAPDGTVFRDLDHDGVMAAYEDPRRPVDERVDDLVRRMTLAEKAGQMFQPVIETGAEGQLVEADTDDALVVSSNRFNRTATTQLVREQLISHFNVLELASVHQAVTWHNALQGLAASTRLGIPVTLSTDPRHAFVHNVGASVPSVFFSQWPEPLGLAALNDTKTVEEFADIARQEYVAIGIRAALHPTVDLATEPRWARQVHTFGNNAERTADFVRAYLAGFQGPTLGPGSVACITKHFPGGGPQMNGEDAHFNYGREQVYPGGMFDHHLVPFKAAVEAGTAGIMPYYGMPHGLVRHGEAVEEVGFGFNDQVITGILRGELGYDGVVCTDWGLVHGYDVPGRELPPKAWGVEHLTEHERVAKVLAAGCDQFGGEKCPEIIIELVENGMISEARLDESVRRILKVKFGLGLFENPYVDPDSAELIAGNPEFVQAGFDAQARSMTLLTNRVVDGRPTLPLRDGLNIYSEGVDTSLLARYGIPVATAEDADIAILRLQAPKQERNQFFLEARFSQGSLEYAPDQLHRLLSIMHTVPTVLDVFLDRPAVIPELADAAAAIFGSFGTSDEAFLRVVFGSITPQGRLPFDLPSSMAAVEASREDVPNDTRDPLFPYGHGLGYPATNRPA